MSDNFGKRLDQAAGRLRSWGAVAIVGAGLSVERMPLTADLVNLLWHALDNDEVARRACAADLGADAELPAKVLIGDDQTRIAAGYAAIAACPTARAAFQEGFVVLDAERSQRPSAANDALAQLAHARIVKRVISLNWDTAFEAAWEKRYGVRIRAGDGLLDKPHGDARHPDRPWLLPHEAGHIPDALAAEVNGLAAARPWTLLVVGYGEADEDVVRRLITPLEARWEVIRIGPSAAGDRDLRASADDALPELVPFSALFWV